MTRQPMSTKGAESAEIALGWRGEGRGGAHCEYFFPGHFYLLTQLAKIGQLQLENSAFCLMVNGYLVFEG